MDRYIFKEVNPKEGTPYNSLHEEVLGRPCYVAHLEIGERALINYEPDYDPGCYHSLHTSIVENYMTHSGEESVTIETQNTIYVLEMEGNT